MAYAPIFEKPYPDGWEDGYGLTEVKAEYLNMVDNTIINIEDFLKNNGNGGGTVSGDYALLSEAGYSLGLTIDDNYVMSIFLLNKAGDVLSTKQLDLPIESMVINAEYADGILTLTLQNGNILDVDISDIVRGLVPITRTVAGIDLADDITKEELQDALEVPSKVSELENDAGYVYTGEDEESTEEIVLQDSLPYPKDDDGNALIGQEGQILASSGNGKTQWIDGAKFYETEEKTVSINTYSDVTIDTLILPAGCYLIQGKGYYEGSDLRYVQRLKTNTTFSNNSGYDPAGNVFFTIMGIVSLTEETEVIYQVYVNKENVTSLDLLNVQIKAIRLY